MRNDRCLVFWNREQDQEGTGGQDGGVSRTETRRGPLSQGKESGLAPESSGEL